MKIEPSPVEIKKKNLEVTTEEYKKQRKQKN
jgi:hypothetical protein